MSNILEYLEKAAVCFPDRTAIGDDKGQIDYKTYQSAAKQIGSCLRKKGLADTGKPIGVMAERSRWVPVLFMGIVYSGNFYVPIAPELPVEKKEAVLKNTGIELVLSVNDILEWWTESGEEPWNNVVESNEAENVCFNSASDEQLLYMIYTSGSTGEPKGIVKTHGAMMDYVESFWKVFPSEEQEVIGNQTPFSFDASAKDIYFALKSGATLEILPSVLFSFPVKLLDYMNEKKVTMISWVPSALSIVSQMNAFEEVKPETLKKVFFVGEVFQVRQLESWRRELPAVRYVNLYGFSEIAGICCYYEVKREETFQETDPLPIGIPLGNCRVLLVDLEGNQVIQEKHITGELYVSSKALAKEYYQDQKKTEQSFVVKKFEKTGEGRYFRTGDKAYYNEEGQLVFASRRDFQIKHRGYRIELEEIEAAAKKMNGVANCGCVYEEEKQQLVLFYEPEKVVVLEEKEVKLFLRKQLPAYMLPGRVMCVDRIPVNANGKTDRMKLKKICPL